MAKAGSGDPAHGAVSEAQLRELFEVASDGLFVSDETGRYIDVNPAGCAMLGYRRRELLGRTVRDLVADEDWHRVETWRQRGRGDGATAEWRLRRKDGSFITVEISARVLKSGGWLAFVRDISERKRADERLKASETRFRQMAESAPVMIWMTDDVGQVIYRNTRLKAFVGQGEGVTLGSRDVVHPDDAPHALQVFAAALREERSFSLEMRLRRGDGQYRTAICEGVPQRGEDGRVTGLLGCTLDVTEARRLEALLRRENQVLDLKAQDEAQRRAEMEVERKRFWQVSRDLFAVIAADGTPRVLNTAAWEATLGYPAAELVGRRLVELVHPDDRDQTVGLRSSLVGGERVLGFENRYRHASGGWVWLSWNVIQEDGVSYAVARDVTEERARAQHAARAQRLEALGQLTGGVAHDFNNLLTTIVGALDLLQRRRGDEALHSRMMTAALAAARRGERLNKQLLTFARREPSDIAAIDLNRLIDDARPFLQGALRADIRLAVELDPEIEGCVADAAGLESALLNLLVNARDATPAGGSVSVRTRPAEARERARYQLGDAAFVALEVTDTGAGMAPDVLARAFEPFFTTKALGEGGGLGLAQVYGFARQSGGSAAIDSEPGAGATVRLFLRRAAPDGAEESAAPWRPRATCDRVLLVEDDMLVAVVTETLLAEAGYQVTRAADAGEALTALRKDAFDVLLTDVRMPGPMDGVQLAKEATRRRPELKVLLCSGWTADSLGDDVSAARWPFLAKPFDERQLRQALAELSADGA